MDRKPDNIMTVAVKTENGFTLTREYGFTVQEEAGEILAFDLLEHPELGVMVLFGNQVLALKFWTDEQLDKGLRILSEAIEKEKIRRES